MIHLTRISRVPFVLNSDLIEQVEATPDTVVSLISGQKIRVLESPETIVERVIQFRRAVAQWFPPARPISAIAMKEGTTPSGETPELSESSFVSDGNSR